MFLFLFSLSLFCCFSKRGKLSNKDIALKTCQAYHVLNFFLSLISTFKLEFIANLLRNRNKEKLQSRFGKQFLHDDVTFKAIWDEVATKEGMDGVWKVEAKFTPVAQKKLEKIGHTFFQGEGIGRVMWSCERI